MIGPNAPLSYRSIMTLYLFNIQGPLNHVQFNKSEIVFTNFGCFYSIYIYLFGHLVSYFLGLFQWFLCFCHSALWKWSNYYQFEFYTSEVSL